MSLQNDGHEGTKIVWRLHCLDATWRLDDAAASLARCKCADRAPTNLNPG